MMKGDIGIRDWYIDTSISNDDTDMVINFIARFLVADLNQLKKHGEANKQ